MSINSAIKYREQTRRERHEIKKSNAKKYPVSVCVVNFCCDENTALTIRSAACFGAEKVMVIGSLPPRKFLMSRSGSTLELMDIECFPNPHEFLEYCRNNDYEIVSAELTDSAESLNNFEFNKTKKTVIVMGNENTGVPAEIIFNSKPVFIPMGGQGFCLNVAMAATVFLNEYCRQASIGF